MPYFETLEPDEDFRRIPFGDRQVPYGLLESYAEHMDSKRPIPQVQVKNAETITVDNFWEQGWGNRFVVALLIEDRIQDFRDTGLLSEGLELELQAKFDRFIELNEQMSILQGAVTR